MLEDPVCCNPRVDTFLALTTVKPYGLDMPGKTEVEKRKIEQGLKDCLKNPKDIYLPGLEDPDEYRKRLNQKIAALRNLKITNVSEQRKELEQQLAELLQQKEEFEREFAHGNGRT